MKIRLESSQRKFVGNATLETEPDVITRGASTYIRSVMLSGERRVYREGSAVDIAYELEPEDSETQDAVREIKEQLKDIQAKLAQLVYEHPLSKRTLVRMMDTPLDE